MQLGRGATLYFDDEGLLVESYIDEEGVKHNMTGMKIGNYPQVIMGNGVILGCDEEGESIDSPVSVKEVENVVTFVEYDNPEDRPQPFMEFISF